MLTKQQIFDGAVSHCLRQGVRSMAPGTGCAYRGQGGTKCAVGALIPDEMYRPDMEGIKASALCATDPGVAELFGYDINPAVVGALLNGLQSAHDIELDPNWVPGSKKLDQFKARVRHLAGEHGLDASIVDAPL